MEIQNRIHPCGPIKNYGYNEGIVNVWPPAEWEAEMPGLVEAVFVQMRASEADLELAHRVHNAFTDRYPQSGIPLVTYDPFNSDVPFQLASLAKAT